MNDEIKNKEIEKKMIKARAAMILSEPFFGNLALQLTLDEDKQCPTIATNGIKLKYNPDFIENVSMDELKGLNAHEVMHCAMAHHVRRGNRDAKLWDQACDYVINPIVLDAGFTLPKGYLFNPDFKDKSTEEIYTILQGKQNDEQGTPDASGKGNNQSQGNGKGKGDKPPQNGNSEGNQPGEVEDYPGNDETGQGATQAEKDLQEQEWQISATQAANQAKACGKLPASLERLIKDLNEPKVNWKEALHRFVEQVSKNDYSWKRVNSRYAGHGIILPSLHTHDLPPIDIYVDTSGSINNEDLKQFASEIDDILTQYNTTARVIYCDTQVAGIEEFNQDNRPITLKAKGGGGTDFAPAIAWSMNQDDLPCCGIYLTDMCCDSFGNEPDFPVLWVATENTRRIPPFGELIRMKHFKD